MEVDTKGIRVFMVKTKSATLLRQHYELTTLYMYKEIRYTYTLISLPRFQVVHPNDGLPRRMSSLKSATAILLLVFDMFLTSNIDSRISRLRRKSKRYLERDF